MIIKYNLNSYFTIFQVMSKEYTNVVFIKVDVDECEDIASEYNISCMPTFLFLKSGAKVSIVFLTQVFSALTCAPSSVTGC